MKKTEKDKLKINFLKLIQREVGNFSKSVSTEQGDWVVKGFIDIAKNIYTISIDTKVIILSREQNFYSDITFVDSTIMIIALKTTIFTMQEIEKLKEDYLKITNNICEDV